MDLISRQAVLDLVNDYGICIQKIVDLPSVNPQKTGRWIESNGVGMFVCSVCRDSFYPMPTCMGKPLMKYCPNCGAKMKEETETWNGYHGRITAPKGTFKKIYEDEGGDAE